MMSGWDGILGHDEIIDRFRKATRHRRLASTYLFVGPSGIGKRLFAMRLAQSLLCQRTSEDELDCCLECPSCQQVTAGTHPDVIEIRKPDDKQFIPLELLVGEAGHRMHEGFCHAISLRPTYGTRRIAIIDDADYLNEEGANALLKTLEEPPAGAVIILIGTAAQRQLPTIRSRSQVIRFRPLETDHVAKLLEELELADSREQASHAARFSKGSLQAAQEWFAEEHLQFRQDWLAVLADARRLQQESGQLLQTHIQAAGTDNWAKRQAMRLASQVAIEFYRTSLHHHLGREVEMDQHLRNAVLKNQGDPELSDRQLVQAVERCVEAEHQVGLNVHPTSWCDAWLVDLQNIARGIWCDSVAEK